jgi:DNA-binding transcriptional MerR regulator
LTQYRIGDLAQVSGVSTRNIRAYRERGLLEPPTRIGRAAIYGDAHLAQLRVIDRLLGRGFTSAHIADFFAAVRSGLDLADVLGLGEVRAGAQAVPVDVEIGGEEAARMVATGLAYTVGDQLVLGDPELVQIIARAPDRHRYLTVLVEVFASTRAGVAAEAEDVEALLQDAAADLESSVESERVLQDYRDLAAIVVARQVDDAVRRPRSVPVSENFDTDVTCGVGVVDGVAVVT